jgi:uncharacterized circularly permuted ATP-grasp superfamily protein
VAELLQVKTRVERAFYGELVRLAALGDRSLASEIRHALRQYVENASRASDRAEHRRLAAEYLANGSSLTFASFGKATRALPPTERWEVFDCLPEAVQAEMWESVARASREAGSQ